MNDDETFVGDGRRSGTEKWMLCWRKCAPKELSASAIERGDDAANAEGEKLTFLASTQSQVEAGFIPREAP